MGIDVVGVIVGNSDVARELGSSVLNEDGSFVDCALDGAEVLATTVATGGAVTGTFAEGTGLGRTSVGLDAGVAGLLTAGIVSSIASTTSVTPHEDVSKHSWPSPQNQSSPWSMNSL